MNLRFYLSRSARRHLWQLLMSNLLYKFQYTRDSILARYFWRMSICSARLYLPSAYTLPSFPNNRLTAMPFCNAVYKPGHLSVKLWRLASSFSPRTSVCLKIVYENTPITLLKFLPCEPETPGSNKFRHAPIAAWIIGYSRLCYAEFLASP